MTSDEKLPLIFDIRQFALDDGPGIRTTVFFKGCPLSCIWCHNPESINSAKEIAFYPNKCIRCGDCEDVCRHNAIDFTLPGHINRRNCIVCGKCSEVCPTESARLLGKYYSVEDLLTILLSDRSYYETSNGGITFSGGEPTLHLNYLHEVTKKLKEESIHIAIQTCGLFDISRFQEKLLPYIDLIFFDIKIIDSEKHKKYTGTANEVIINNFKYLLEKSRIEKKFEIIARTPLIPGVNDSDEDLNTLHGFYKSINYENYQLLPYNPGGVSKKLSIGLETLSIENLLK